MEPPTEERRLLGLRVSFLWGALVGVPLVLAADVWLGVLGPEAGCQVRPTFYAAR